ncbi:MAG: hypothetical protein Q7K39_00690 [Candidatus Magasanikbacteria bacterium]|nr:hypothetical protein [Candidatus Magasanikbacteria bacterium]
MSDLGLIGVEELVKHYNKYKVNQIVLDKIINEEALGLVQNEGKQAFVKSGLNRMVDYIVEATGRNVQQINVGDIVLDPNYGSGKYFNVTYILK